MLISEWVISTLTFVCCLKVGIVRSSGPSTPVAVFDCRNNLPSNVRMKLHSSDAKPAISVQNIFWRASDFMFFLHFAIYHLIYATFLQVSSNFAIEISNSCVNDPIAAVGICGRLRNYLQKNRADGFITTKKKFFACVLVNSLWGLRKLSWDILGMGSTLCGSLTC